MSSGLFWGLTTESSSRKSEGEGRVRSGSPLDGRVPPLKTTALAKVALSSKLWKLLSPLSLQAWHFYKLQGTTLSFVVLISHILAHTFINIPFSWESYTGLEAQ